MLLLDVCIVFSSFLQCYVATPKRSTILHDKPRLNPNAPPLDVTYRRLSPAELLRRTPPVPSIDYSSKAPLLSVERDYWHCGFPLGYTKLIWLQQGSSTTFTIECVDEGEWFGTDSLGKAKRFSPPQFFELATWEKDWLYLPSSWYFDWARRAPYRNANWREAMLALLDSEHIIIPSSWLLDDLKAQRFRNQDTLLSNEEVVDAAIVSSSVMTHRNDALEFLWYAAAHSAQSSLWDDRFITTYLVGLESERHNASCVKRASSAIKFLQTIQNSPQILYFSFSSMDAVRKKMIQKYKSCPQTPLEIEAWMVRDVLRVYVWQSSEPWSIIFGNGFSVCFKIWMRHDRLSRLRMDKTYLEIFPKQERAMLYLNGYKN